MRRILRLALLPLLCSLILGCNTKREQLDLTAHLKSATDTSILSPQTRLSEFESRAFVANHHVMEGLFKSVIVAPTHGLETQFLVFHRENARLIIQGISGTADQSPVEVQVSVNGKFLQTLTFEKELSTHEIALGVELLREGVNLVSFAPSQAVFLVKSMVKAEFHPQHKSKIRAEHIPFGKQEKPVLFLPYTDSIDFPLATPGEDCVLEIAGIEEWREPGAPSSLLAPELMVRLRSDNPPLDQTTHHPLHKRVKLSIPENTQSVSLTLSARPKERPLLGQKGLRLTSPVITYRTRSGPLPPDSAPTSPVQISETPPAKRPNVVLYLIDTLRPDHLSCYGYERETSPHFDALADDGVLFEDVAALSPWTKPSTVSILTGLHPAVHGAVDFGDKLHQETQTLAEILNAVGYESRAFSANVFASDFYGVTQGFKTSFTSLKTSHFLGQRALEWLDKRESDQPFFLYIHTIDPHTPYSPPQQYNKWSKDGSRTHQDLGELNTRIHQQFLYRRATKPPELEQLKGLYDGEILSNDAAFGKLVSELKSRDLYDNTLIVVISDHGEEFFEHGGLGHVNTLHPELIQVPWIVKFPAQLGAGTRVNGQWQQLDVAPTILRSLGHPIPKAMTGLPYNPVAPIEPTERSIFLHLDVGRDARSTGQAKKSYLIRMRGLRKDGFSLLQTLAHRGSKSAPLSLYNRVEDPQELQNVLERFPVEVSKLRSKLKELEVLRPLGPVDKAPARMVDEHLRGLQYLR